MLAHCAQSIECSVHGYPKLKPAFVRKTIGRLVVRRFLRAGQGTVQTNGVIPLAVALEKGAVQGVNAERGSTRLVVTGDSLFLANGLIENVGNYDFASLAINWLLARTHLVDIPPKPVREYQIFLTQPQLFAVRWILLVGLPGSVLLLGFLVWLRRRQ